MTQPVLAARVDRDQLRGQIQDKYTDVALAADKDFHFHTGRPLCRDVDYDTADVDWLPETTVESFAGTGNPFSMGPLAKGEVVLDIGCGAGFDTLLAARQVGSGGRAIAVDMTEAMLEKTRVGASALGLQNVDARHGYAEELPVESESIDVVISNGVINLCPRQNGSDAGGTPGAEAGQPFSDRGHRRPERSWSRRERRYRSLVRLNSRCSAGSRVAVGAGPVGLHERSLGRQVDVFSGSKHESDARDFDTHGVTFSGVKPA